jgi:hypothetical protein
LGDLFLQISLIGTAGRIAAAALQAEFQPTRVTPKSVTKRAENCQLYWAGIGSHQPDNPTVNGNSLQQA